MARKQNKWYVLTGGPSTGKTTLLQQLQALHYSTIPEAARQIIDEFLARGISIESLRADELKFQAMVAKRKASLEASVDPQSITFFERGMHDTLAYVRYYNFAIDSQLATLLNQAHYSRVFLLEPLDVYHDDYARVEDANFTRQLHQLLYDAYSEFNMKPITIPNLPVKDRLNLIISNLD